MHHTCAHSILLRHICIYLIINLFTLYFIFNYLITCIITEITCQTVILSFDHFASKDGVVDKEKYHVAILKIIQF